MRNTIDLNFAWKYSEVFTEDMAGWFITVAIPDRVAKAGFRFDADLNNFMR